MGERTVKEIDLKIDPAKSGISRSILLKILNFWRLFLSFVFALGCTLAVLAVGFKNEAVAPLVIFLALITLLFLYLFLYALKLRPEVIKRIEKEAESDGAVRFKPDAMEIKLDGQEKRIVGYKDVKGQYWMEDGYYIFIDSKTYRTVLSFSVDKESFDDIYMLSSALNRKKVKLIQINKKKEKVK